MRHPILQTTLTHSTFFVLVPSSNATVVGETSIYTCYHLYLHTLGKGQSPLHDVTVLDSYEYLLL
jgi:hypothetical protein